MTLERPDPFREAVESRLVKRTMPTLLRSVELEAVAPEILERAVFSARVTHEAILEGIQERITRLVKGVSSGAGDYSSPAFVQTELKKLIVSTGYKPEPGKEGTIEDLSSDRRVKLITEMNAADARGYGFWKQSQNPRVLERWPCFELYRQIDSKVKRNWLSRWQGAGGKVYGGRMIARKDDPIWVEISRFRKPYPPFDFNSGMRLREIRRDEAIKLGVIEEAEEVEAQDRGFDADISQEGTERTEEELA